MENEKIINLLEQILTELKALNTHAETSAKRTSEIMRQQQEKADKLLGSLKQHLPPGMAEILGGGYGQ